MANRPITVKINCSKIDKAHLFQGKNGKYLDLVIWPNRDGKGQYGDTHYVVQAISKAAREAGEKGVILGSATFPEEEPQARQVPPQRQQPKPSQALDEDDGDDGEEIPF